ncbi:MAG: type II toxin-antitoxin system PemK/MazF family toxin [Prolixibacteraceae bacterium]|jgi:mRNA interferase MazF|nr:type II toxin-antitoxin system PemK/MazF family toxin [Prolixibacteraceae bacterium]
MRIKQFDIWTADLNPQIGTEPGKIRPVLIVQTDLLNSLHPSTIICPITTNVVKESDILRVHIKKGTSNMQKASDLMIDQIRAIDNRRFIQKIGELPADLRKKVTENLKIVLDFE